jgi:hypothetical protein
MKGKGKKITKNNEKWKKIKKKEIYFYFSRES